MWWYIHLCCKPSVIFFGTDRDRVPAWRVRRWKEALQHWDGAYNVSVSALSGWTHHWTGFQHCQLHHPSTAQVLISSYFRQFILTCEIQKAFEAECAADHVGSCSMDFLQALINIIFTACHNWCPKYQLPSHQLLLMLHVAIHLLMPLCMSRLSRRGKTVIFSIHQPRYSIFRLFDHLTLMHKGEVVYAGAAAYTLEYFTKMGTFICEWINIRA